MYFNQLWSDLFDIFINFISCFFFFFFLPLFENFGAKIQIFGNSSKMQFSAKNLTIEIDSMLNFFSKNVYFIFFSLLVFKLQQKLFSQNATKLQGWHYPLTNQKSKVASNRKFKINSQFYFLITAQKRAQLLLSISPVAQRMFNILLSARSFSLSTLPW